MNVAIEGERYRGVFQGDYVSGTFDVGSEYYTSTEKRYWYKGWGFIDDRVLVVHPGRPTRFYFGFQTPQFRAWGEICTLEESLINYHQKGDRLFNDLDPKLVEGVYPKVIDLGLDKMVEAVRAQWRAEHVELAHIRVSRITVAELVERGLSYDRQGQLHLPQLVN